MKKKIAASLKGKLKVIFLMASPLIDPAQNKNIIFNILIHFRRQGGRGWLHGITKWRHWNQIEGYFSP